MPNETDQRPSRQEHGYVKVLAEHLASVPPDAVLRLAEIWHEGDCGIFRDDWCDCEPEIRSGPAVDAAYGL